MKNWSLDDRVIPDVVFYRTVWCLSSNEHEDQSHPGDCAGGAMAIGDSHLPPFGWRDHFYITRCTLFLDLWIDVRAVNKHPSHD